MADRPNADRLTNFFARETLRELFFGASPRAMRFQTALFALDVVIIAFFIVSPFLEKGAAFLVVDYAIAAVLAVELLLRAYAADDLKRWIAQPIVWADVAVLVSLLVPEHAANLGFLRILRVYSIVNGHALWRIIGRGRWADTDVCETVRAATNLFVFIFLMTGLVHASFAGKTPHLQSYLDSLYFTITALTTTGFGDITLPGAYGRILSIVIMVGGVTLFVRLGQVLLRPRKTRFPCPSCGLLRHETDAVCCKACGTRLALVDNND